MMKRRTQTRLEKSFLDINVACSKKAKKLGMKEKSLVRMAENSVYYGIAEDDPNLSIILSEFFIKLRRAYQRDLIFYLNSDYLFVFGGGTLVDLAYLQAGVRGEAQACYKNNKVIWDNFDRNGQEEQKRFQIEQFNINSGLEPAPIRGQKLVVDDPDFRNGNNFSARTGEWYQEDCWGERHLNDI